MTSRDRRARATRSAQGRSLVARPDPRRSVEAQGRPTALRQRRALLIAALEAARDSDTPNRLAAQRDPGTSHGFPRPGRYWRMNVPAYFPPTRVWYGACRTPTIIMTSSATNTPEACAVQFLLRYSPDFRVRALRPWSERPALEKFSQQITRKQRLLDPDRLRSVHNRY
jgi:hypothetical protein